MKGKAISIMKFIGLGFLEPIVRIASGELVRPNLVVFLRKAVFPIVAIFAFYLAWDMFAGYLYTVEKEKMVEAARLNSGDDEAKIMEAQINSGEIIPATLPGPTAVKEAAIILWSDHKQIREDMLSFEKKWAPFNKKRTAKGLTPVEYTGRKSFIDQIIRSLKTVGMGFLLAALVAVPLGIVLGLSETLRTGFSWIIQIFKPVSPVVWLLLVSMIVKTLIDNDPNTDKAFIISFISVAACSMWATLVNSSMGVASVDKDFVNVSKVLKLGVGKNIFKIVLPASLPLIFTGMRITVSVAWMVLIAIELLAQSDGLGKFVWDEFQNGSSTSNAKIIVAMFVIGFIGFFLDRVMLVIQNFLDFREKK